jgi:acryloyl-coenzyme A reductase
MAQAGGRMKAAVVRSPGGPEALVLESIPEPVAGPRDVIVSVAACGVCFHDVVTRNGTLRAGIRLPFVPGHEVAGTVTAVGAAVREFKPGDRVASTQRYHICGHCRYCRSAREPLCDEAVFLGDADLNGGYAERVAIEADNLAIVPPSLSLDDASIAACAIGTMLHAIRIIGQVKLGESVLVTGGGGGLGLHGIQLARRAGAYVIAQTTTPAKVRALEEAGAQAVVLTERGGDFSADVKRVVPDGVDVVIDTVGTPLFTPTRRSLAKYGRWVLVGQLTGDFVPFNPAQLFLRGVSLLSATSTTRQELIDTLDLLARGEIRAHIGESFPLDAIVDAHRLVESGRATGRVIVKPH